MSHQTVNNGPTPIAECISEVIGRLIDRNDGYDEAKSKIVDKLADRVALNQEELDFLRTTYDNPLVRASRKYVAEIINDELCMGTKESSKISLKDRTLDILESVPYDGYDVALFYVTNPDLDKLGRSSIFDIGHFLMYAALRIEDSDEKNLGFTVAQMYAPKIRNYEEPIVPDFKRKLPRRNNKPNLKPNFYKKIRSA